MFSHKLIAVIQSVMVAKDSPSYDSGWSGRTSHNIRNTKKVYLSQPTWFLSTVVEIAPVLPCFRSDIFRPSGTLSLIQRLNRVVSFAINWSIFLGTRTTDVGPRYCPPMKIIHIGAAQFSIRYIAYHVIDNFLLIRTQQYIIIIDPLYLLPGASLHLPPDNCLLYTSPSPRDQRGSRMPSSA